MVLVDSEMLAIMLTQGGPCEWKEEDELCTCTLNQCVDTLKKKTGGYADGSTADMGRFPEGMLQLPLTRCCETQRDAGC
jgi:hypothetical protein